MSFRDMDPQRHREIAAKGGRAAHEKGAAHEWTSMEARYASHLRHGTASKAQRVDERLQRVLLIGDRHHMKWCAYILQRNRYRVESVGLGADAVQSFTDCRPRFVIADMALRDYGGAEIIQKLRRLDSSILVIAMCGNDAEAVENAVIDAGAAGVLVMPVTSEELAAAVVRVAGRPEPVKAEA